VGGLGQVALEQSLPPLHRMAASVKNVRKQNVKDVPALDTLAFGDRGVRFLIDLPDYSRKVAQCSGM